MAVVVGPTDLKFASPIKMGLYLCFDSWEHGFHGVRDNHSMNLLAVLLHDSCYFI